MTQAERAMWESARMSMRRFIDPDGEVYYCVRCGAILNTLPIPEGPTLVSMDCPSCRKVG